MSDHGQHPSVYYDGRECRRRGGGKMANPFSPSSVHGAWWLAGFNDADIELGSRHDKPRKMASN
ncbi:hypothetical protein ABJB81_006301 [Pseudomonas putida]